MKGFVSFIVARQLKRISVLLWYRLCNNGMKYTQNDLLSSLREEYIRREELDQTGYTANWVSTVILPLGELDRSEGCGGGTVFNLMLCQQKMIYIIHNPFLKWERQQGEQVPQAG